ncbi:hypothetical protein RFI_39319, partial [Reticulomyxa filosa]
IGKKEKNNKNDKKDNNNMKKKSKKKNKKKIKRRTRKRKKCKYCKCSGDNEYCCIFTWQYLIEVLRVFEYCDVLKTILTLGQRNESILRWGINAIDMPCNEVKHVSRYKHYYGLLYFNLEMIQRIVVVKHVMVSRNPIGTRYAGLDIQSAVNTFLHRDCL